MDSYLSPCLLFGENWSIQCWLRASRKKRVAQNFLANQIPTAVGGIKIEIKHGCQQRIIKKISIIPSCTPFPSSRYTVSENI